MAALALFGSNHALARRLVSASRPHLMVSHPASRSPFWTHQHAFRLRPYSQTTLFPRTTLSPFLPPSTRPIVLHHSLSRPAPHTLLRRSISSAPSGTEKEKDTAQKSHGSRTLVTAERSRIQRIWLKVKEEASHYWHGTKLLGKEIRLSAKYQIKLLKGKKLTRRERRQLKRTTTDLLRLIPFSVFLIVPFMELLLPVALRLFPNMLPSTFQDESKELEKKRKLLKVRLEMAKFLQETLKETGGMSKKITETEEFKEFFRKVRSTGEKPSMEDVVKVARFFEDDLTLDNLSRPQLVSMCRYMNINAFGTDNFLRYTIRKRMKHLQADDAMIDAEGIDSLSVSELRHACQSRGIRSLNVDEDELRKELAQWIDLHLHHGLSPTLLILGRAFAFNRGGEIEKGDSTLESLKDALSSLPDTLLNEAELEASHDNVTNKQRLTVLEEQEELIEDEREQEQKEEDARKAARELERSQRASAEEAEAPLAAEAAPTAQPEVDPSEVRMTSEQLAELGEALSILSAKSSVLKEKMELKQLAEENREAAEDPENTASAGLVKGIQKMIQQIDQQLEEYDTQVGNRMHQINIGQDGKLSVADLKKALEAIKHRPADEAISVLIDKLDVDHDGFVPLEHVVSLAEEEGLGIELESRASSNAIISQGQKLRLDGRMGVKNQTESMMAGGENGKEGEGKEKGEKKSGSFVNSSSRGSSNGEKGIGMSKENNQDQCKPKKSDIVEDP